MPSDEPDDAGLPASTAVRRRATGGLIVCLDRPWSYADWLDERDARHLVPPDRRVRLVTESGETIASTSEKDVSKQRIALS